MSMNTRSPLRINLSLLMRCGGDICSPDATKGVITCAYSPPKRKSVRIASPATSHSRTPSAIAEGVRECDVAGEAMRALFRLGGEYAHVMTPFVASGEHMSPPHRISSDKRIRNGDLVFI